MLLWLLLDLVIGLNVSGAEDENPDGKSKYKDQVERNSFYREESSS